MSVSLRKALTKQECAIKPKHLLSVITETLTANGEKKFWTYIEKLPLNNNNILAWKFCYILHRQLSDGHARALIYAEKKQGKLIDLGYNWSLSQENYSNEIKIYTALLATKLKFHTQFPQFPGNLIITLDDLKKIGGVSISIYGEITMAITDYLELICKLRTSIFKSLKRSKCNSMMPEGQCRLQPITLCFQDAVRLHDIVIKILDLSPSCLPMKLTNYRERYREQISSFHDSFEKAMKYQFLFETMPDEVKKSHESQKTPKILEGSEGIAEMVIQSKRLLPQSEGQLQNQKIIHETISALEEISQQFVKVLSTAKEKLGNFGMVETEEMPPKNNAGEKYQETVVKNVPGQLQVKTKPEKRNEIKKTSKTENAIKDVKTFENKLDELLERYLDFKLRSDATEFQESAENSLTSGDRVQHLLQLLQSQHSSETRKSAVEKTDVDHQPKKSKASKSNPPKRKSSVRNDSYEILNAEEINQLPDPPKVEESIAGFWNYADEDSEEYITILGQRLQQLLDKMYSIKYEYEQYDLSKLQLIEKENSLDESENQERSSSTDIVKTEENCSDSELDSSSLGSKNDASNDNADVYRSSINYDENDEKVTLKTILKELQKIQETMLNNKK